MPEDSEKYNIELSANIETINDDSKIKYSTVKKLIYGSLFTILSAIVSSIVVYEYQQYRETSTQKSIKKETNKTYSVEKTTNNISESELVKTIPFGASTISPSNIPVLNVRNEKANKYTLSTNVSVGDVIFFEIHSFANNSPVQNLNHKLGNLRNKIFKADSSANITAIVSATGVPTLNGSVSLFFNETVKLEYAGYKWYIRKIGANIKKTTRKELPNKQHGSFVYQGGVLLGSLPNNYSSNFLIKFKAVSPNGNPK